MKHSTVDWRKLGECQKVIKHSPEGGMYEAVTASSEGLLAVMDSTNMCVHLLTKEGALVRSIGKGMLGGLLYGVVFDLKGNVWVADWSNKKVIKLSQDGRLLQTIHHARNEADRLSQPCGVSVSPESLIYICDRDSHRVTVHEEEGKFLFAFGSFGSGLKCFDRPRDITFGSDGLVYVSDEGNKRVCVWSKEGRFKRVFKPKHLPTCIAATNDNHLLITSHSTHTIMVYTLEGKLVHEFGGKGCDLGKFNRSRPNGICVDNNGLVYVVVENKCVLVFEAFYLC